MEEGDLVLLEQEQDAVVVLFDDLVLARQHPADIDVQPLDVDAVVGEMVAGLVEVLDDCSSAFEGMQPTLVQVPPGAGPPLAFFHSSMQETVKPSCAARIAAM